MPRRNKLPTGHLTPSDIIRHDDGSKVIAYNDGYQPPVAAEPPAETPSGIPLPPTLNAKHVLLAGIGEACHWDEERRREEAEAENWLINILAEQKVYVGSRTYIHSIPLFTPASYETKRMTRKLMLLPSVARSTLAETNDILDYIVSHFASKRYVVRESGFSQVDFIWFGSQMKMHLRPVSGYGKLSGNFRLMLVMYHVTPVLPVAR